MFKRLCTILVLLSMSAVAGASVDDQLKQIIDDYWSYYLDEFPVAAKNAGLKTGNDRLESVTPESLERRLQTERRLLARLRDLDTSTLPSERAIDAELLIWVLEDSIGAYELELSRIPFNTFWGFFMNALTASNGIQMRELSDYEDYVERLEDIPRYFEENIGNMRRGMEDGFVLPRIVIAGVLPTVQAQVKGDPEESSFYELFESMSPRVSDQQQSMLRDRARDVIENRVIPAYEGLAAFLRDEYRASESIGAGALPNGKAFYAFQIRRYTTTLDMTPAEIHAVGLNEVARIREEMQALVDELEFDGDLQDFAEFLRTDPQFYASTPGQLLREVAYVAKRIDHKMPGFFGTLPRQSYGVVAVPDEIAPNYTTGSYNGAPLGGSHGGEFWVNTFALDQRPLYEIPALTLHEAAPGHHHQSALSLEMPDAPDFRKDLYFSAFGEGWALYAEWLGIEMGIYQTPYEHFGRLSYEMWRACRLVIDTGIHAMGWTRQQSIDYLAGNTSLTPANIRAEIDRYISWPGQALAYKIGEIKIRQLRDRAERELGSEFDLREFHDAILENGAVPLAMLERQIERFILERLPPAETAGQP
ncbi:MAG: DUF885 domain-containing protein [Woeseiaceae bacterium]|nr:DUF885 domain-containing protein [Woeseiaceae bacterium]